MSFLTGRFLGLSLASARLELGLGSQVSSLTTALVRDELSGDAVSIPDYGTPVYFQFYGLTFAGLLQRFAQTDDPGGNYYEAVVTDPREVLDGAQLITSGYSLGVTVPNLLNVFGYWESQGFGQSGSTPAGMPAAQVFAAVNAMVNSPAQGAYGGPLTFRGVSYGLDLRELPTPPGYYRLPSGNLSLLEAITLICEDCGCDFFVQLVGLTIKIRVVSRFFQPPLGTIRNLVLTGAYSGAVAHAESGVEVRNETTSVFLTGGEKTGLRVLEEAASYWGTDVNGLPVIGEAADSDGPFGSCEFANLNAADCSDVLGSTTYRCSTWEMRFALFGREGWDNYIDYVRPNLIPLLGNGLYDLGKVAAPDLPPDVVNDADVGNAVAEALADRRARLFDLVRRYAEDFYGKQYLVRIPFVDAKVDPETGQLTTTMEPTATGYLKFGAASLGVPANRLDVLQDADERVFPFAYYPSVIDADTARMNWGESAVDDNGRAWTRAQVSPRIIFIDGATPDDPKVPTVHVRLPGALYDQKVDEYGDADLVAKLAPDLVAAQVKDVGNQAFAGTIGHLGVHPAARTPSAFGVALKSNVDVYGPWFVAGAPGKVRYEQDPSLTPWDYGSEEAMELAGQARVLTAVTNQQLSEAGGFTVAAPPAYSPGDTLATGGPNLTNLSISVGVSGVTTGYRFATFTPRYGVFGRQNAERVRRLSLAQVEARRQMRKALNRALVAAAAADKAARGAKFNQAFWQKKQSPHTVLYAGAVTTGADTRQGVGSETYESALALLNQGGNFGDRAMMSLNGLVRGFSTSAGAATKLPKYGAAPSGTGGALTRASLDPFAAGNDTEILAWGQAYAGAHAYRRGADAADTRAVALRGPLVVAGWGPGVDGKSYPNDGVSGTYLANTRKRSDLWKVGPVDLLWDDKRATWTMHDIVRGMLTADVNAISGGTLKVNNSASWTLPVYNPWSSKVKAGIQVMAAYVVSTNQWELIAADCS